MRMLSESSVCVIMIGALFLCTFQTDADSRKNDSIISTTSASRAEIAAVEYTKKARKYEKMASASDGEAAEIYSKYAANYRASAREKWGIWQAYHFGDSKLLEKAKKNYRELERQRKAIDKWRRQAGVSTTRKEKYANEKDRNDSYINLKQAGQHEISAVSCTRQAIKHERQSIRADEKNTRYHNALAASYHASAEQHWRLSDAYRSGDYKTLTDTHNNVRILKQKRVEFIQHNKKSYYKSVFSQENIQRHEFYMTNYGIRATKLKQMALLVNGDLKTTYKSLAANYHASVEQMQRKVIALRSRNRTSLNNALHKLESLGCERKILWTNEKEYYKEYKKNKKTSREFKKVKQIKQEYLTLREQLKKLKPLD